MNINHKPLFDINAIEQFYTDKDGVEVKYVCTSAIGGESVAGDIFYRATPHPEFGNRYFRLIRNTLGHLLISNADNIEDVEFGMVEGLKGWEYSQHRHDFHNVEGSGCAVDGGRAYMRRVGNLSAPVKYMKIVDGKFVDVEMK